MSRVLCKLHEYLYTLTDNRQGGVMTEENV